MEVRINVDAGELHRELRYLANRASGLHLGDAAEELKLAIEQKIAAEGAVGDAPRWPELEDSTKAKSPNRAPFQMLQLTGLLAAIQTRFGSDFVEAASPAPYAGFHVTGTVHMKPRDFTDIDWEATLERVGLTLLDRIV